MTENTMKAGSTVLFRFTAREADGTIIPLVGVEIVWILARDLASTPLLVKSSLDSEIIFVDPANGKFTVELSREETAELKGPYVHEAKLVAWPRLWTVYSGDIEFEKALAIPQDLLDRIVLLAG